VNMYRCRSTALVNPIQIHLRRLSTGDGHPSAPRPPVLLISVDRHVHHRSYFIQISRNHLGVMIISGHGVQGELVVWDWKTGNVKMVRS
jgi:hypothetical protein